MRERGQGQANYLPFLINFTLINAGARRIIIRIVTQGYKMPFRDIPLALKKIKTQKQFSIVWNSYIQDARLV